MLQLQEEMELAEHPPVKAMVLSDTFRARILEGRLEGMVDPLPGEKQAEG